MKLIKDSEGLLHYPGMQIADIARSQCNTEACRIENFVDGGVATCLECVALGPSEAYEHQRKSWDNTVSRQRAPWEAGDEDAARLFEDD